MHLVYLGLTHTEQHLDEHLAWATRDRPGATALLEHVLAAEVDAKSEKRLVGRIRTSGLVERKTLEGFDWNFQPSLDKGLVLGDATIAAAILDRLAMHAIRIDIDGPSFRQHVAS